MNYKLPPQNLGNLDPEKRVEFVRAQGISEKSSGSIRDSDDIPEGKKILFESQRSQFLASTSVASTSSGFASIYQNIIDRTTVPQNTIKTEVQGDSDDDVIILEDVVKTEPERNNLDIRDVNGFLRAAKDGNLEEIRRFLKKSCLEKKTTEIKIFSRGFANGRWIPDRNALFGLSPSIS
uniref:Uncharacterized protein n=1 Tax=Caenorhabditis tropicalis TaxID=1561998 RepID=A0A1I7UFN1_9PELO